MDLAGRPIQRNPRQRMGWLALAITCLSLALIASSSATEKNVLGPHFSAGGTCLTCHSRDLLIGVFLDGSRASLSVPESKFNQSVHAQAGMSCLTCHSPEASYPHDPASKVSCTTCHLTGQGPEGLLQVEMPYGTRRDLSLELTQVCSQCHAGPTEETQLGMHAAVFASGNREAPICIDCHPSHELTAESAGAANVAGLCGQCHRSVSTSIRASVHGLNLAQGGSARVPTCVDCHGAHTIRGPHERSFRAESVNTCSGCHGGEVAASGSAAPTILLEAYLADPHGRGLLLSLGSARGGSSIAATCSDCHGVHVIRSPEDPLSLVHVTNLPSTCQRCHIDGEEGFAFSYQAHPPAEMQRSPTLLLVEGIYSILIGGSLAGSLLFITADARKRRALMRTPAVRADSRETQGGPDGSDPGA